MMVFYIPDTEGGGSPTVRRDVLGLTILQKKHFVPLASFTFAADLRKCAQL
jgi:hypothetical protein